MYRIKETKKGILIQKRIYWFWFTISDPLPKDIAEPLLTILNHPAKIRKLQKEYNKFDKGYQKLVKKYKATLAKLS